MEKPEKLKLKNEIECQTTALNFKDVTNCIYNGQMECWREHKTMEEEMDGLKTKISYLPQAWEFRIWCICLLFVYFATNPKAFNMLKGLIF